jgi:hypothetical protein
LGAILWAFPREKIVLGVLEVPDTPKNKSGQLITKLAPKLARIGKKKSHPFPLWPTIVFWKEMKGIWKKWETYARLGKSRGESQVERHFVGFPGEKYGTIILEVLEMPGTPQKQKWAAATITKQTQKLAKKNQKPVTTNYFPFPTYSH